jgi:hypothetical protein
MGSWSDPWTEERYTKMSQAGGPYLEENDEQIAKREVRNKLRTGLKNPRGATA